tara:strand:- start:92 stop:505 length:414 start_codon:yes stop_codon:yes gene_type:complete
MGYLKNQSYNLTEVSGTRGRVIEAAGSRCKLFAVQFGYSSQATDKSFDQDFAYDGTENQIILRTSSYTGDIMFNVAIPFVSGEFYLGTLPFKLSLEPNYILFEDGMYLNQISNAANDSDSKKLWGDRSQISLFYELG